MRLLHLRHGKPLVEQLHMPDTLAARMRGLLGFESLPQGAGMLLTDCRWVHSFGMRFAIDLVFLDADFSVVALHPNLAPNRLSPFVRKARMTLELPAGALARHDVALGDKLELSE